MNKPYEQKNKLVVVLSRNYATGLSVIRSLGAAGYTVDLVASAFKPGTSKIAASSKYVRKSVEVVSRKVKDGGDDGLVAELLKYKGEKTNGKPVLFATDDYTASVMDMNRDALEEIFIMPHIVGGGQGSMTESMNKTVQGELARKAGILTPLEWVISLNEGVEIPQDMVYPCFVKPIESVSGYKREMARCNNEDELFKHLDKLRKRFANRSILVQEFLEIDNEIDFSGVCFDQDVIIPAIIKKTNVAQFEKGVTLSGKLVPFEEMGDLQENIIAMMKSFHYVGMFDFELAICGDKIYFNEVNLRSGGPNYSYFKSGVNLPALYVKEAFGEGHDPEEEKVDAYEKSFIYEKIAWEDHINGFMSRKELKACIEESDITLLCDDDDPVPGEIFTKDTKNVLRKKRVKDAKNGVVNLFKSAFKKVFGLFVRILRIIWITLMGYPQTKRKNRRNPNSELPRVLVSGRNYCSNLTMARSLGKAGYEVEVLRIFQMKPRMSDVMRKIHPEARSKYIKGYYVCVSRRNERRIVNRLIKLADPNRRMLLIPADDLVAYIADHYYDELSEYYLMPNVNDMQDEIGRLMNKNVQKELAIEAGLPVLNSCVVTAYKGNFEIPETVTYPCFIKPNVSKNSAKSRMRKCENEQQLAKALKEFSRKKPIEMLVEEFVEIEREYSILGVSTKAGAIGPGFFTAEVGGQAEHRGVAVVGKTLPCSQEKELIDNIVKFVSSLNFDGLYDVDLVQTADGKIYFVELNMRFGASGYAFTESGCNLPAMFADYMLKGKPIDLNTKVEETGKTFVSDKVLIDEFVGGRMSLADFKKYQDFADVYFIKNEEDPKPFKHFKKFFAFAYYKGLVRKINRFKKRIRNKINAIKDSMLAPFERWVFSYPQNKKQNRRNPNSDTPRILVAGRNYCSNLTMARSLGKAGYEVEVLRIFQMKPKMSDVMRKIHPEAHSKYIKAYHVFVSNRKEKRIVAKLIELADTNRKMLLLPADDLVAYIADHYYDELSEYYLMPNVNDTQDEIGRLMNKGVQKELAIEAGLPVLNSCVISAYKGKFEIPDTVTYPCFVKPNVSKNSSKSRMRRCNSRKQLSDTLKQFSRKKPIEMVVEDFVEIEREYSILGVSTKAGANGPAFFTAEVGGQAEHRGVAVVGKTLPCSQEKELIDNIVKFVSSLNFDGLYDVDLVQTADGKIYFVELNMRFGASGYAFTESGCNLPAMFADYMLKGKPIDLNAKVKKTGKTFVSDKVLLDEFVNGRMSLADFKKYQNSADIYFIKSEDDPETFKYFKKFFIYAYTKGFERKINRIKKKIRRVFRRINRRIDSFNKRLIASIEHRLYRFPQWNPENRRNPQSELPRVLISGRNYCSNLTMARSIGKAGYEVEVLKIFQMKPKKNDLMKQLHPDAYSKYIKAYHVCISNRNDKAIVKRLVKLADPNKKMLLLPADDLIAYIADRYYTKLSRYYYMPNVKDMPKEIGRLMSKGVQKQLAIDAGLPVLNSTVIKVKKGGRVNIPPTVHYPCFIKPNVSKNSSKSRMRKCDNEKQLVRALKSFSRSKPIEMLVEDFVEIEREYSILGVSTRDGVIGPGFFTAEVGGQAEHRGVAVVGKTLPCSQEQELIDKIVKFISTLEFDGLYDVDLVQTKTGKIYFVELNLRFGASGYAFTQCGVNLPGMFADYMIKGTPIDLDTRVEETGKTFVSEKVLIDEYVGSRLSKSQLNEYLNNVDIHFIMDDDDRLAYEHFSRFYPVGSIMRFALKCKSLVDRLAN